jgi:hypothetical protein
MAGEGVLIGTTRYPAMPVLAVKNHDVPFSTVNRYLYITGDRSISTGHRIYKYGHPDGTAEPDETKCANEEIFVM